MAAKGGCLVGLFLSQIGLPANQALVLTGWPDRESLEQGPGLALDGVPGLRTLRAEQIVSTARPTRIAPCTEPGVYAHRWFEIAASDWTEFLALSEAAWPEFEKSFGVEIEGLFRSLDASPDEARVLLLTRYPSLAVWERSRVPDRSSPAQQAAFENFRRRGELTRTTVVVTTRLARAAT